MFVFGQELKVPKRYKWLAVDSDGSIGAYKSKPWILGSFWDCPCNEARKEVGKMDMEGVWWGHGALEEI